MKKIFTLCLLTSTILFSACKKNDGKKEEEVIPTLRTNFNYATIDTTSYVKNFVDIS
jgi:hypothetical protein